MTKKMRADGFLAVGIVIAVLVVAVIGFGGWYVWDKNNKSEPVKPTDTTTTQTKDTEKTSGFQLPSGWIWFESKDMGLKFAHPNTWMVSELRETSTAAGEQGWTITAKASEPKNGDPGITFSTYPANATIRDVDAGSNDVKVQDITTDDKVTFTLVGTIEDPSKVTKPTQMYPSTCWPRQCAPRLANGRILNVAVGSTNNDCAKGMLCPTEINNDGENYGIFLSILKSIKSL